MGHPQERSKRPEPPFCWQNKQALRTIREAFDSENTVCSALAVYLVLTEIGSDEQSTTFRMSQADIAAKAGVSKRTALSRLHGLKDIGLVAFDPPKLRDLCTYTLLSLCNGCVAQRNGRKIDPLRTSEEESEKKEQSSHAGLSVPPKASNGLKEGGRVAPRAEASHQFHPAMEFTNEKIARLKLVKERLSFLKDTSTGSEFRDSNGRLTAKAQKEWDQLQASKRRLQSELMGTHD